MTTWNIDPVHSEIGFKVKHLMVSTVKGKFDEFSGTAVTADDSFVDAKISFEANVASITTHQAQRDEHLRSSDFFDAEHFPKLTFVSKSFTKTGDNAFALVGDFTMRGVAKEITLSAIFNGIATNPMNNIRVAAFDVSGKINRMDFGVKWNAAVEAGGVVVSEDVAFDIGIELKEEATA